MRVGAHVKIAGGLDKAIDNAVALGAEAIQIFGSAPQAWAARQHPAEAVRLFNVKAKEAGIADAVFLHGIYLVNLATENQDNLKKGVDSLSYYLGLADEIGAKGVIFHVGSHKGAGLDQMLPQIAGSMTQALDRSKNASLIIENNAGRGQQIGATFQEIKRIIDAVGGSRVKVCLDTCHSLSSGYDVRNDEGVARAMDEFDSVIGLENLVAVHANDSKAGLNSGVDRHENIGDGHIGREGFASLMRHPAFRDVPFLLEVPGIDGKSGPDAENVQRLKAIRDEVLGKS